jgi:ATP-dependent DNA ligase
MSFPVLYGKDKSGKIKVWRASVHENPDGTAYSLIEYGQLDGKMQTARRDVLQGKNIGKKNETSAYDQCLSETQRKWLDKRDKENYSEKHEQEEKEDKPLLPMLAQQVKKLAFPCYVQPKIDGLRCLMYHKDGKVVAQSRTGAFFTTVEHLQFRFPENVVLDGELYTTAIPFETLAGLIKKKKISDADRELLKQVEYHCYDVILLDERDATFERRYQVLSGLPVRVVETVLIQKEEEFRKKFGEYTADGYEGIMVRSVSGVYAMNYRSKDLCKYKEFEEAEYPIVAFTQGDGRDAGTVIWVCETPEGKRFNVRPRGTLEQRAEWYQMGEEYVGKRLTVVYQNLSEQNVPRFPVGKAIRDGY